MEDILKELGTWAAENLDAIPQKFQEALQQRRPLHAPEDSSMSQTLSQAGPSKGYSESAEGGYIEMSDDEDSDDDSSGSASSDSTSEEDIKPSEDSSMKQRSANTVQKATTSQLLTEAASEPTIEKAEIPQYTPEDYLSKKPNNGRRIFRHTLRMAASEAKALGVSTYKELTIPQRSWIHNRVTKACKSLKGHERDIDDVLVHVLIQAKQYKKRKAAGKVQRKGTKQSKGAREDEQQKGAKQSEGAREDEQQKGAKQSEGAREDEEQKGAKRSEGAREDEQQKGAKQSEGAREDKQQKGVKRRKGAREDEQQKGAKRSKGAREDKQQKDSKQKKGRKRKHKELQEPMSEYEKKRMKNVKRNEAILSAVMKEEVGKDPESGPRASDSVIVLNSEGVELANAFYVRKVDDIFSELIFVELLQEVDVAGIQLPVVVMDQSAGDKTELGQLENNDKFIWKTERVKTSRPIRRSSRPSGPPDRLC